MKKLFLFLIASVILLVSGTSSTYALELTPGREKLTESAFSRRYNRIPTAQKQAKVTTLNQRIIKAKKSYSGDQEIQIFLSYIQSLLTDLFVVVPSVSQPSGNTNTTTPTENTVTQPIQITPPSFSNRYEGEKVVLGGSRMQILSKVELVAKNEPIEINEIILQSSAEWGSHIETLYIFDASGTLLGSRNPSTRETKISGIRYLLEQGSTNLYIVGDIYPLGISSRESRALSFSVGTSITKARGYYSGASITMKSLKRSDTVTISPVIIDAITPLSSYKGYISDDILVDGENTLLLFSLSTMSGPNKQASTKRDAEAFIEQLTISVNDGTVNRNVVNNVRLQRLDTLGTPQGGEIDGDSVIFRNLPSTTALIESDDNAVYRIVADVSLSPANQNEYVQITISDLYDGGLIYKESTGTQLVKTYGGLGAYQIVGLRVKEF